MCALGASGRNHERVDRTSRAFKANRFRLMELDAPNFDLLPEAVHKGIAQCIALFTEKPPRGKKENFGTAALENWAQAMRNPRARNTWTKQFPRGGALYQGLLGTPWQPGLLGWVMTWGTSDGADRGVYADFLEEATLVEAVTRRVAEDPAGGAAATRARAVSSSARW